MKRSLLVIVPIIALVAGAGIWRALAGGQTVPRAKGPPAVPPSPAPAGAHGFGFAPTLITPGVFDRAAPGYGVISTFKQRQRNGRLINGEARKPQFSGWIGGVFIKGNLDWDELPPQAWHRKKDCGHTVVPPPELVIPAPRNPPPGFTEIGAQWANMCGDEVNSVSRNWEFDRTSVKFNVIRYVDTLVINARAREKRIHLGSLGGRTAVYIDPFTPEGVGTSGIIVAEGEGVWGFQGVGMQMADLEALAAAVFCDNGRRC